MHTIFAANADGEPHYSQDLLGQIFFVNGIPERTCMRENGHACRKEFPIESFGYYDRTRILLPMEFRLHHRQCAGDKG